MMKTLFVLLSLLMSSFSHASMNADVQFIQQTPCLDDIQEILADVTHPSYWVLLGGPTVVAGAYLTAKETRITVLENLDTFETLVKDIQKRILARIPNDDNFYVIKKVIKNIENDTVLGMPVGAPIASCIKPLLTFNGTPKQQMVIAKAALQRIASIRKAVN